MKSDIELFRRAVCDYEFKRYQEAEDTMVPLMERYPEVPGFVKFKSRFLMERARNGIDMVEAELYIDEALRLFPEDGYFLKYQGELLWMKGKCADALEVFADAREKTNNGITQLELDKFLNPYGRETVKTCQQLLDVGQKDGAMKLMALWYRLLPENPSVREYYYLARASVAKKRSEVEELIGEILKRIDAERAESPGENNDIQIYKRALTKAWERLGYPGELARVRTDLVYTSEADDLEWLAERAKDGQIRKEKRAQVYKVIGDVRRKQGQTEAAFQNYLEHCGRMEAVLCERSFPEYFSQICMKEAREQLYMQKPEMLLSFESVAWKVWKYRRDTAACERMLVTHISQKAFFKQALVTV